MLKGQEKYWLKELSGELPILNLPTDKQKPIIQTYNGSIERIIINKETVKKLKKLSKKTDTTFFILLFTMFNVFLYRITGQNDLIVGTPSVDRNYQETEEIIGLFVNTLAIRSKIKDNQTFNELLLITKNNFLEVLENKNYPFEQLVEKLNPIRDMNHNPLFNVLFQIFYLKDKRKNELKENILDSTKIKFRSNIKSFTKFDITMKIVEIENNSLILNCEYNTDLFEKQNIERFLRTMKILIENIIKDPNKQIKKLEIVARGETHKLIHEFNNTKAEYPNNKNINIRVRSTDLAFIVYTSGSTGNPKGVMINHQGVINHALTKIKVANINSRDIISVNLSVGFVAFIWQLIAPLMIGARAQIYSDQIFSNVIGLIKNCTKDNVTIFEISPSLFSVYLDSLGKDYLKESRFKKILLTGEKIPPELVNKHYQRYQIQLINAYGQAECSDDTLHYVIPKNIKTNTVPAGKPSNNTQVYILNKNKQLQPIGIPGELYISGDGLARGYINDLKRTKEVFLDHPFQKNKKIYKTGDLAKMHEDGNIEILGRVDHQIKIRGYRIEPGEIEEQIKKIKNIKDAVVIAKDDSGKQDKYLVAYYTTRNNNKIKPSDIKEKLKEELPEYMIPSIFVYLKEMPLNQNGKLDRNNLPQPEDKDLDKDKYKEPKTKTEKTVARIWQEVLDVEKIGLNDNFFNLGGHSLKAIQVLARINKEFNIDLGLKELFKYPILNELSKEVEKEANKENKTVSIVIPRAEKKKYYKLSHAQRRMFVLYKLEPDSSFYNAKQIFKLVGNLDIKKLEQAFNLLIERHEVFRTNFKEIKEGAVQVINENYEFRIKNYELNKIKNRAQRESKEKSIIQEITNKPFKLETDSLLRAAVIRRAKNEYMFVISTHHIIWDRFSTNIFHDELAKIYNAYSENKEPVLSNLKIQYKDYAEWEQSKENKKRIASQEKYWLKEFKGELPVADLPTDHVRPAIQTYNGKIIGMLLGDDLTKELIEFVKNKDVTIFTMFLTIFNLFIHRITDKEDIVIGTTMTNRNYTETENSLGFYLNTLPIRKKINDSASFNELLKEVKNKFLDVYNNKDYPFERLIEKLNPERDTSRNPLFNIFFEYLNPVNNQKPIELIGLKVENMGSEQKTVKFDIRFRLIERLNGKIRLVCDYNTDLFKAETISNYLNIFNNLIQGVIKDPEQVIKDINLLSAEEE